MIKKISEYGYKESLLGLGLNFGKTSAIAFEEFDTDSMNQVARKLALLDGGHNKFLESIIVYYDITLPRYAWQDIDTYRVGMSKQSESTNHTIMKGRLTQSNFHVYIEPSVIQRLNYLIVRGDFEQLKSELPEGFLQRRILCTNYKTVKNIYQQRKAHKLSIIRETVRAMVGLLDHSYLILGE